MKTNTIALILGLLFSGTLFAGTLFAQSSTTKLVRIQTDPQGGTGQVTAFFQTTIEVDGQTFTKPMTSVSWAIGSGEAAAITLSDGTEAITTRAALFGAVSAIAYAEKELKDNPPPAPEPDEEAPEDVPEEVPE